jgi:hypothetical protein
MKLWHDNFAHFNALADIKPDGQRTLLYTGVATGTGTCCAAEIPLKCPGPMATHYSRTLFR